MATLVFQIFNIILLVGFLYFIFALTVKFPKQMRENQERMDKLEHMIQETNKKLEGQ